MPVRDLVDLLGVEFPYIPPLVGGPKAKIISPKGLSILGAPEKLGKSQLVLQLALCRALEEPWLDYRTMTGVTLYINAEITEEELQERLRDMLQATFTPPPGKVICASVRGEDGWHLNMEGGTRKLKALVDKYHPDLVILDPLTDLLWGDESDPMAVRSFLWNVKRLPGPPHSLIVHHFRKASKDPRYRTRGPQELSGSGILTRSPDSILWAESEGEIEEGKCWLKFRLRNSPSPKPMYLERGEHQWWEVAEYTKKKKGRKKKYNI